MPLSRRSFVLAAGGASLALTGAFGAYQVTRLPERAAQPWRTAADAPSADVRLDALRHAILAPNPHNRQPWLMRLVGEDEVVISCDLDRRLPHTDPFDRQIAIGFGCFLELARIAAAERGVRLVTEEFPEGEGHPRLDGRPIARLRFVPDPATPKDPLFAQILRRRSVKEVYEGRPVGSSALGRFAGPASPGARIAATSDPAQVEPLRRLILDAGEIEGTTRRAYMESVELMRIGRNEIEANPDGIDLDGPMIEGLKLAGLIDRAQLADTASQAYRAGAKRFRATYGSGASYLWIATPGNSRRDQLAAGRHYVRANLLATELGLAMHPASQALQEYPEMAEAFARAHRLMASAPGERVQMLARVGHCAEAVRPSPRWPLESRIVGAGRVATAG